MQFHRVPLLKPCVGANSLQVANRIVDNESVDDTPPAVGGGRREQPTVTDPSPVVRLIAAVSDS